MMIVTRGIAAVALAVAAIAIPAPPPPARISEACAQAGVNVLDVEINTGLRCFVLPL